MKNSNLLLFYKRLTKPEIRAFAKFIRSPYFNQRQDILLLNEYLVTYIRQSRPMALEAKVVFRQVYPQMKFDDKRLRHSTSVLFKLLKKFLAIQEYEANDIQSQKYLCRSLRNKNLEIYLEKELKKTHDLLEQGSIRDSNFYLQKYQLWAEEEELSAPLNRAGNMEYGSNADQLSIAFISNILHLSCGILTHQTITKKVDELKLLPGVLDIVDQGEYLSIPVVAIYFHGYRALEYLGKQSIEKSEKHFHQLKGLIHQHWKLFSPQEIRGIYVLAINYCIKRLNAGARGFIREAFELFRSGLTNNSLLENEILSVFTYKNITRLGIALDENEWVEQFLSNYKNNLHPGERENAWRYNQAFVYFKKQNYQSAMQLLVQVEFKDVLNNLDARRMLLKSYFELNEYSSLDSLLSSFTRYIQRQKDMGYHRENYLNMIRFVKGIIHLDNREEDKLKKLRIEIEGTEQLAERDWLLEKLKERED